MLPHWQLYAQGKNEIILAILSSVSSHFVPMRSRPIPFRTQGHAMSYPSNYYCIWHIKSCVSTNKAWYCHMVTILDHTMPFKPNNAAHILQYGCNAGAGAYSNSRHTISYPKLIPLRTQNHTISYPSPSNFVTTYYTHIIYNNVMYFFNLRLTCILILIFYKYFQGARHQNYLFHGELLYWRSGVVIFTSSYNI